MNQPETSDFDVKVLTGGVNVNFKPTFSYYRFDRLVEPDEIKKLDPISLSTTDRHMGSTGATGDYVADEVATMAHRLASSAAAEAYK